MVAWSHYIDPSEVNRGDHIYALRGLGLYQHHGIVVSGADASRLQPKPTIIETFMVIEQNREGLDVVTLYQFAYENIPLIKGRRDIRRALYGENPFAFGIKRRGSCYIQPALTPDMVVENAILIFNDPIEKAKWSSYSVLCKNCEHFAFKCCTDIGLLSEQILGKYDLLSNTLSTAVMTATPLIWGACKNLLKSIIVIGEKLVPSTLVNVTITSVDELIKNSVKGNIVTALIAFGVEIFLLTTRWIIYLCVKKNQEKLEKYLANGGAISTETYIKCFIQAIVANGVSFSLGLLGTIVGAFFPLPGATIGFSIFFSFIGYAGARWGAGAVIEIIQKWIEE